MKVRAKNTAPTAELVSALAEVLAKHFGRPRTIVHLRRRISPYSSSSTIENLEVELDGRQRLRLVLKDLSPDSTLTAARTVRPAFLYRPEREIRIYQNVLPHGGLGTAVCYGSVESEAEQRYWLFLERVEGPLLWQVGSMAVWEDAARWLALLHSRYELNETSLGQEVRVSGVPDLAGVLHYDERLLRTWLPRAETFLRSKHSPQCRAQWRHFDRIANRYDRVIERLLHMDKALIHGEFFPSNIIVRDGSLLFPICPIDWEVAGVGPGLVDLAALTLGNWSSEKRTRLIGAGADLIIPEFREHECLLTYLFGED